MIRKIDFLLCTVFIFCSSNISAQNITITGSVKSKANASPLAYATVQFKEVGEDGEVLFFGFTDDNGNYHISGKLNNAQQFKITVSYLGYKRDSVIIEKTALQGKSVFNYNFQLEEDSNQLNEIYIKAPPPVQVGNDTTTYNVARFTSPADRNLEDVLKKMPGIAVDRYGAISFKGKKVGKILLEGDDLTGEGYKAITKNLKPQFVKEVQALEHYVEDNLLKGIINSDDVALNLKIKNKQAKKIVGSADMGLGTNERISASANLVSLLNKSKAFTLLKHSNLNTDYDIVSDTKQIWPNNQLIRHNIATYNVFDETDYTQKNTSQLRLSALTRVTDKFKLKYGLAYFRNQSSAETSLQNTYYAPAFVNTQNNEIRGNVNRMFNVMLDTDYFLKTNARLWGKFSYKQEPQKYNSTAYSVFNSLMGDSVLQQQKDVDNTFLGEMKYTLKANGHTAYLLSAKLSTDRLNQNYGATSVLYNTIPIFNGATQLVQQVAIKNTKATFDFEALKKYNANYLYFNVGSEINSYKLKTDLLGNDQSIGNQFKNDSFFNNNNGYVLGKYVYDIKYFKVQTMLKATLQRLSVFNNDTTLLLYEPTISLTYQTADQIQSIFLTYNYKNNGQQAANYYRSYMLTDVRNLAVGLASFFNYNTHTSTLNYNYNDFTNSFLSLGVGISASYSEKGFLYNNTFVNTFNYTQSIPYKGLQMLSSTINTKKFIPFLSTLFTGFYSVAKSVYFGQLTSEIKKYSSLTQSAMIKLNTGFNLPVNFGANFNFQTNKVSSEGVGVSSAKAFKATLAYQLKLGSFFNTSSVDFYKMNNQHYNLIDTEIQYNPSKGDFKYSLIGKNLTNLNAFSSLNVSEVSTSSYSSSILGRYFLLSVSMSIK